MNRNMEKSNGVPPHKYEPTRGTKSGVKIMDTEVREGDEISVEVEANMHFKDAMPDTFTVRNVSRRSEPTDGSIVIDCEHPDFTVELDDYTRLVTVQMNRPAVEGMVVGKVVTEITRE